MSTIYLVANGDMRTSANRKCEAEQRRMEQTLIAAIKQLGGTVRRAHEFRESLGHSFIDSQKYGMEVFKQIPSDAPLIIAEAVWQYSHHLLHGLMFHQGPILTVAKWSGMWPGLVGMLNLNGSMAKAGIKYSTLWSEDFENDQTFLEKLGKWMKKGEIEHDTAHVKPWRLAQAEAETKATKNGIEIARSMRRDKAIMGVFDEGCMGMFNAIIPDCLLHPLGVFKERLSQSSLYYAMTRVSDAEANAVYDWYKSKGVTFHLGKNAEHATKVAAAATFKALNESGRLKSAPKTIREIKPPRFPQKSNRRRPARSINQTPSSVNRESDTAITTMPLIAFASPMPWPRMISGPKFQIVVIPENSEVTARNSAISSGRRSPGRINSVSDPLSWATAAAISANSVAAVCEPLTRSSTFSAS